MEDILRGMEPALLWEHFRQVSRIPRASGNEGAVRKYVVHVAGRNGLPFHLDTVGNVLVRKPASRGRGDRPVVVIQGHLDMVCEKNRDSAHDFSIDPLRLARDVDWVWAQGTSLGADNGIGMAASLAIMEDAAILHGPLELLFTVNEETGLFGAHGLEPGLLAGTMLLNLDTDKEGTFFIGCAGGVCTDISLELKTQPVPAGLRSCRVRVGGLTGGHSGTSIHEGRGNAIRLLSRVLAETAQDLGLRLAALRGGERNNAIPRECEAIVCLPGEGIASLKGAVAGYEATFRKELEGVDPKVFVRLDGEGLSRPRNVLAPSGQERLLRLVLGLPNGVIAMMPGFPDTVGTSTNLGYVLCEDGRVKILTLQRSSSQSALDHLAEGVAAKARSQGGRVTQDDRYPGWPPNPESPLLQKALKGYRSLFDRDPEVKIIHAGLECGIIGDKAPGMDMLSFGPTIRNAHSPGECVEIGSVQRFWDLLVRLLEDL